MKALALLYFRIVVVSSCDVFVRAATNWRSEVQVHDHGTVIFCKFSFLMRALATRVHTAGIADTHW